MTALQDLRSLLEVDTDQCIRWERSLAGNGYGMVRAGQMRGAHVVMCEWAHGPKPLGHEVAHACGVRCCVNRRHLRWATHVENVADRRTHGTDLAGSRSPHAVLTESDIPVLRARRAGGASWVELGRDYGVSRVAVRNAVIGKTWKHVA